MSRGEVYEELLAQGFRELPEGYAYEIKPNHSISGTGVVRIKRKYLGRIWIKKSQCYYPLGLPEIRAAASRIAYDRAFPKRSYVDSESEYFGRHG